jgi:hypothetical protein
MTSRSEKVRAYQKDTDTQLLFYSKDHRRDVRVLYVTSKKGEELIELFLEPDAGFCESPQRPNGGSF